MSTRANDYETADEELGQLFTIGGCYTTAEIVQWASEHSESALHRLIFGPSRRYDDPMAEAALVLDTLAKISNNVEDHGPITLH